MSSRKLALPGFRGKWSDRFICSADGYIPAEVYINEDSYYWKEKATNLRWHILEKIGPEKSWDLIDKELPGETIQQYTWKQIYEIYTKISDRLNKITGEYFNLITKMECVK